RDAGAGDCSQLVVPDAIDKMVMGEKKPVPEGKFRAPIEAKRSPQKHIRLQLQTENKFVVDPGRAAIEELQTFIQDAGRGYWGDIEVSVIRANKRSLPTQYVVFVDGKGSTYCLNKRDHHSTALIYFRIDAVEGTIAQHCTSRKQTPRHEGVPCSAY